MSNLRHWLWLTTREGYPGKHTTELLQRFGTPERVYFAQEEDYHDIEGLPSSLLRSLLDKNLEGADQILFLCGSKDIQIITLQDAAYPQRLAQLPDAPLVLYVKGTLPVIDQEVAIAVVGAREASPYGITAAGKFGLSLARQGALILSGTAKGIDSAALTGALKAGGQVVAVLGNGVDVPYPSWNQELYDDIAAHGALVSEYPPGTKPAGRNFPVRNRILSGLSLGVLVVEGTTRSGSLITARHAIDQGREVFAVPGNIDAPLSEGPNGLIRRNEAKLVQDAWDVLTEYELSYPHKIRPAHLLSQRETQERLTTLRRAAQQWPQGGKSEPMAPRTDLPFWADEDTPVLHRNREEDALTDDEATVLQALQQGEKRTADELAETTGIPLRRVMSSLTLLQIRKGVKQDGGLYSAGAILRE